MMRTERAGKNRGPGRSVTAEAGFTLIEVLIAISILSVGLLAIASMQIMSIQTTGGAKHISQGTAWAEDRMEMLSSLDYDHLWLNDTGTGEFTDPTPPPYYSTSWSVDAGNPVPQSKLVTVYARWNEGGRNKVTSLTSVIPEL
jgi:type IV pilus assembly protein PilV